MKINIFFPFYKKKIYFFLSSFFFFHNTYSWEREGGTGHQTAGQGVEAFPFSHSLLLYKSKTPLSYSRLLLTCLYIHLLSLSSRKTGSTKTIHTILPYSCVDFPHICSMICKFFFPPPSLHSCFNFYLGFTFSPFFLLRIRWVFGFELRFCFADWLNLISLYDCGFNDICILHGSYVFFFCLCEFVCFFTMLGMWVGIFRLILKEWWSMAASRTEKCFFGGNNFSFSVLLIVKQCNTLFD